MVDPETFHVWQALQPDVLPPGVKSWQESPGHYMATTSYDSMLPAVTYLDHRRRGDADVEDEWNRGTRNFRSLADAVERYGPSTGVK